MIKTLLNTRPLSQSIQTQHAFSSLGFDVINFPCIEIVETDDIQECINQLNAIKDNSIIIFTSQQAVISAFKIKPDWQISQNSILIAVGSKTAEYLEQYSANPIFVPEQQNSQGVIDILNGLKEISSISLISAENGRQEIQNYALVNNIALDQINVYQRQIPNPKDPIDWFNDKTDLCVLATSINGLENLKLIVGNKKWMFLQNQLFVCASARIESSAKNLGINATLNTNSANPKVMAEKLRDYLVNK